MKRKGTNDFNSNANRNTTQMLEMKNMTPNAACMSYEQTVKGADFPWIIFLY